ncbi:MAG TPA: tetratricopeptide repeat protein, partial [Acetobacteraceae bacterium]|nr:tetratricopeptide repeat protein [Acetobacteraceae bacterium]
MPPFDFWCPLLSLPRLLGTRLDTIPAQTPYLHERPALAERWRKRLAQGSGLRVGLVWAGSDKHINDFRRSLDPARLQSLFDLDGVSWVSLQVGPPAAGIAALPPGAVADLSADITDFAETAGAILNLDLVITVDTAVAHLAGALNRPTWVMLPFSPDWRWMTGRADYPWYPSLRLFRQPSPGDWDSVIARVRTELAELVAERTPNRKGVVSLGHAKVEVEASPRRAELTALVRAANEHHQAKRHAECETALRQVLRFDPGNVSALHVLALTRFYLQDRDEAVELMQRVVALQPKDGRLQRALGILLHEAGRFQEALAPTVRSIALNPHDAAAHNSFGATLTALDRLDDALAACAAALAVKPDYFECWTNIAHIRQLQGRPEDAAASYQRALGIRPDYAQAQCGIALLALLRGDYAEGFTRFEWRWHLASMPRRDFKQPAWQGEPLRGKVILLHAEQGAGDTLQCLRFVPEVAVRGGRLLLEVPRSLALLTTSLAGGGEIVPAGQPLPPFDVHCAFMSLPRVLGTTLATLPAKVPYLGA